MNQSLWRRHLSHSNSIFLTPTNNMNSIDWCQWNIIFSDIFVSGENLKIWINIIRAFLNQLSSKIISQMDSFQFHYPVQKQVEKWLCTMFHSNVDNHIHHIEHFEHEYSEDIHLNDDSFFVSCFFKVCFFILGRSFRISLVN